MSWMLGQDSFSKCVVYFADGNTRTFYSLDWTHKLSKTRNRELGLLRLRRLIASWGKQAKVALLYDTATGQQIESYHEGIRQTA